MFKSKTTKNAKRFPDFINLVSTDSLRPVMCYAIVENGKLIGTNSYVIGSVDLRIWLTDENGDEKTSELENIEGKIFNIYLLTKLAKPWANIIFKADSILFEDKNGMFEETMYSGFIDSKKLLQRFRNYDVNEFSEVGMFPNYEHILPEFKKGKLKTYPTDKTSFNLETLAIVSSFLKSKDVNLFRFKDSKNSPILVTPIVGSNYMFPEFSEVIVIMPISNF